MARIALGALTTLNTSTHLDPMLVELYQLRDLFAVGGVNVVGYGVVPSAWSGTSAIDLPGGAAIAANGNGPYILDNSYWDGTNWIAKAGGVAGQLQLTSGSLRFNVAASVAGGSAQTYATKLEVDALGNFIPRLNASAPTLTANNQMVFSLTSNTNLRISVRGTDGVTRHANITLA